MNKVAGIGILVYLSMIALGIAGWITHLYLLIGDMVGEATMTTQMIVFYVIGIFVFPIGAIHGIGNWFGAW